MADGLSIRSEKEIRMSMRRLITAGCACLLPGLALAQSSFIAPDKTNRFPGVTIFCPSGTGVAPCNFGGGGSAGGSVSITSAGSTVSMSNRFPVSDAALDALINNNALSVSLSGTPIVALGAGSTVAVSVGGSAVSPSNRLPVSESVLDGLVSGGALTIGGTVSLAGSTAVTLATGGATIGGVTQSGAWSIGLAAGGNAIGSVSVSNLPATQPVSAASLPLPSGAASATLQSAALGPMAPANATATNSTIIGCAYAGSSPTFTAGQQGAINCDSNGRPYVNIGANAYGNLPTFLQAVSSGGATVFRAINTASSTMATNIKASSGLIYGYEACNAGASAAFFRIFGLPMAPVPGTSVPTISKLLPAGTCQSYSSQVGLTIPNGIGLDVTSGSMADTDGNGLSTANQVTVELYYK